MTRSVLFILLYFSAAGSAAAATVDWQPGAAAIAANCDTALTRLSSQTASIARGRSHGDPVIALENAVADARDALAAELFVWNVTQDAAVRDASRACRLRWRDAVADTLAEKRLYAALASRQERNAVDRALANSWRRRMQRGGAALTAGRRDEYLRLAHELNAIEDRFWTNLANDRTTIRAGRRTIVVDDGTFDFLRTERGADAREAYERAFYRRAAAANVPLLERAVAIRDRLAHLLGFESWADYRLAGSAIGDLAAAQTFLRDAAEAYAAGRPPASTPPWDIERDSTVPANTSVDSVLDAISTPLEIRFARTNVSLWAPGVRAYTVSDASTDRELGVLYVDLARRPGKNASEAVQTILYARSTHEAATAIVASWSDKSDGTIEGAHASAFALDVGTALASLLATVPYESLADVPREARELDGAVVARAAGFAFSNDRQALRDVAIAQIDLAVYSSGSHVDTTRVWAAGAASTFTQLYDPGTFPQVASPDLMEGWDATLYARPWSRAYAADAASAGGERYRHEVFEPAASRSLSDELRDLLGRDPKAVMP